MNIRTSLAIIAACFVATFAAGSASAQTTRTWVSGTGNDANPCTRTAPCQTFTEALSKTSAGGEINCLDAGGYGFVVILKSITIDCSGNFASILVPLTTGVFIDGPGIVVTLRNISINGAGGTTGSGVRIAEASSVNIDNVVIQNFGGTGVNGRGVAIETSSGTVRVNIQNSRIYGANSIGIHSNPAGGSVILNIDNVTVARGGSTGIQLRQLTTATINRASVTNHATGAALTLELGSVVANVSNSNFSDNQFGVFAGNGGTPTGRLYASVVTGSTVAGLVIGAGSQIISAGNNLIRGNSGNEVPSGNAGEQ